MRAVLVMSTLLLVGAPTAPAERADTYPRRIGIDVERYRFELTLEDGTDAIEGRTTVSVLFTANGVTEVVLDLASLDSSGLGMVVRSVSTETGEALSF